MRASVLIIASLWLLTGGYASAGQSVCQPQPLPPAIDSADLPPIGPFADAITFAATPDRQFPGRAWVVRLDYGPRTTSKLIIVRLRRRSDCNRYGVEKRWEAPLSDARYDRIANEIGRLASPPRDIFSPTAPSRSSELVLHGTALTLRVQAPGWAVERNLNHYESQGPAISAVFHQLISNYLSTSDMPAEDWRHR